MCGQEQQNYYVWTFCLQRSKLETLPVILPDGFSFEPGKTPRFLLFALFKRIFIGLSPLDDKKNYGGHFNFQTIYKKEN